MSSRPTTASGKPTHVGLIDGRMARSEDGSRPLAGSRSAASRVWMILAIVFFIISLALAAYVAYDKISEEKKETDVLRQYPGYFRTPAEQAEVERQIEEDLYNVTSDGVTPSIPSNNNTYGNQSSCQFGCYGQPARRKRRAEQVHRPLLQWTTVYMTVQKLRKRRAVQATALGPPIYHGCCISRRNFVSPDEAENLDGKTVTLVQLNDKRQYFPSQECKHARGCTGCGCGQESTYLSAVVKNDDYPDDSSEKFVLNSIKLPGCCKCFNNLLPP